MTPFRLLGALLLLLVGPVWASEPQVRLETSMGDIVLELDATRAPETVENFLAYVDNGFYDGTIFHRVIEGFMIQGGGFDQTFRRKHTRAPIRNEANNGLGNRRYTIAMARTNAPHSATAQFFINSVDNPNLDHRAATPRGWGYAVFGRVIDGQSVVDAISQVATGPGGPFSRDTPRPQVVIDAAVRLPGDTSDADLAGTDSNAAILRESEQTTSALSEDAAAIPATRAE